MKKIFLLAILVMPFFSGCTDSLPVSPKERIIEISDSGNHRIGKGVIVDNITLMTASHVYHTCEQLGCHYKDYSFREISLLGSHHIDDTRDIAYLGISPQDIGNIDRPAITVGMDIYALVSRSGFWERKEGKILDISIDYIGYDAGFSGSLFTGAIQTNIYLEPGESGTPVWSLSGGLIGIMTASDERQRRGYIRP